MVIKIRYFECKTKSKGLCYYCDKSTDYILEDDDEEIFCCFSCGLLHIKHPKIRNKVRNLERKKRGQKIKILHVKKVQNGIFEGGMR